METERVNTQQGKDGAALTNTAKGFYSTRVPRSIRVSCFEINEA